MIIFNVNSTHFKLNAELMQGGGRTVGGWRRWVDDTENAEFSKHTSWLVPIFNAPPP
ncbi:MAG: hypothetical protein LBV68_05590 [Spirochaetaceae bacterium]|nr:hypothetical protein [Spirochaetaceae bacterium]